MILPSRAPRVSEHLFNPGSGTTQRGITRGIGVVLVFGLTGRGSEIGGGRGGARGMTASVGGELGFGLANRGEAEFTRD